MEPQETPRPAQPGNSQTPSDPTTQPASALPTEQEVDQALASDVPTTSAPGAMQSPFQPEAVAPIVGSMPLPVSRNRSRKRLALLASVIAVILVVLGGSAAASYYYMLNKPDSVLKQALGNAFDPQKAKTVQFGGEAKVTEAGSGTKFSATFTGNVASGSGAFSLDATVDALVTNITFSARSTDGKTVYLKAGGLDGLPQLLAAGDSTAGAAYAALAASVNNQWFEITPNLYQKFTGNALQGSKLSDADRTKLGQAYEQHPFLKIVQTMPSESIAGINSYHYKIGFDKTRLKEFAAALKSANLSSMSITASQLQDFSKSVDKTDFNAVSFEVWVGKSSKMFTQISVSGGDKTGSGSLRIIINSYNKPVTVQKPAGAKSVLDLLGSFFGGQAADSSLDMSGLSGIPL